jgi:alpha-ketoglutarate-dependent taurine dioxygenase
MVDELRSSTVMPIYWRARDLLVIDNQRMLHARGSGSAPDQDRVLARILIRA